MRTKSVPQIARQHKALTMAESFQPIRTQCAAAGLSTARVVAPGHVRVPSRTQPGLDWHVLTCPNGTLWCQCPAHTGCWHIQASAALLAPPPADTQARAAAALTALYGEVAA
jgi:hypothetical protein